MFAANIMYSSVFVNKKQQTMLDSGAKLLQKSEMRKDIVIELSYKGFG